MKAVRFYKNDSYGKLTFSVIINKEEFSKKVSNFSNQAIFYFFVLCGLVSFLTAGYCVEQMSMSFDQFILIVALGAIGSIPLIILHWEKVKELFAIAKEKTEALILRIFA